MKSKGLGDSAQNFLSNTTIGGSIGRVIDGTETSTTEGNISIISNFEGGNIGITGGSNEELGKYVNANGQFNIYDSEFNIGGKYNTGGLNGGGLTLTTGGNLYITDRINLNFNGEYTRKNCPETESGIIPMSISSLTAGMGGTYRIDRENTIKFSTRIEGSNIEPFTADFTLGFTRNTNNGQLNVGVQANRIGQPTQSYMVTFTCIPKI